MPIVRIPLSQPIETRNGYLNTDSKCVNGYFEMTNHKREFVKRPGTSTVPVSPAIPTAQGQGLTYFKGFLYAVVNNVIYKINPTTYARTTVGTMTGLVNGQVANCYFEQTLNDTYLFVHNQVNGYTINGSTGAFKQVTNDSIAGATILTGGSGYSNDITVSISPPASGTAASGTVQLTNGIVTGITITNGGSGYTPYDTITFTFSATTGSGATASANLNGFPTGSIVPGACYLDTYTVIASPNGQIYTSNPNDPTTWNALNYITAEAEPDALVGIAKHLNYIVSFGQWSIDWFYDAGTYPGSPLANAAPYHIELGCANGDSIVSFENIVVWVGTSRDAGPSVYAISGTAPTKLSTPFIDRILQNSTLADIRAYSLRINGHTFYVLTLADLNVTIVYDVNEKVWTQWTMWAIGDADSGVPGIYGEQYFRPSFFTQISDVYYLLDDDNGTLYTMSDHVYTDSGAPIYYRSVTDNIDGGTTKRKFFGRLEIVGDKQPAVMNIRHSDDDYKSWSPYRAVNLNKIRPQIYQSGAGRRRAWEFLCTDNVPLRLLAAEIDFDIGELEESAPSELQYRT
jgi:Phage stabilisation protein